MSFYAIKRFKHCNDRHKTKIVHPKKKIYIFFFTLLQYNEHTYIKFKRTNMRPHDEFYIIIFILECITSVFEE